MVKIASTFRIGLNFRVGLTERPRVSIMCLVYDPILSAFMVSGHLDSIVDSTLCQDVYQVPLGLLIPHSTSRKKGGEYD